MANKINYTGSSKVIKRLCESVNEIIESGGGGSVVLINKNITTNGTYNAVTVDSADGYREVVVNVSNSYSAGDEGKVVNSGALVSQSSTTKTANGTYNTTLNNEVVVNVPNTYTAGDEGKVVSNGALVAQTSDTITENGTYDTTLNNEIIVNVAGGGGSIAILLDEHEYKDTSGGTFSYEKTVTIPKSSTYSIAVISYSNAPTIKINNVAQSYSFYNATDYIYYYTSELALTVGDEISISVTSSGKSAAYAQIIDLDATKVILSGTGAPTATIGNNEDLYIQYENMSSLFDYDIGIVKIYRKVNGAWVDYTQPGLPTKGVHIWTKSTGGYDAVMYVQDGYWDVTNNQFVATGEVVSVVYTSVQSSTYDCNGIATLSYPSGWSVYATDSITDGTNDYNNGDLVKNWPYNGIADFYIWKDV